MSARSRFRVPAVHRSGVALAGAVAALAFSPAAAHAATAFEFEGATLSSSSAGQVVSESAASGGKAQLVWSNAGASKTFNVPHAASTVTVRARGTQCSGGPQMAVDVDGARKLLTTVSSTSYADYTFALDRAAGNAVIKVSFLNDYKTSTCDRNLYVDKVTFVEPTSTTATTAPAPTTPVAPSTTTSAFGAPTGLTATPGNGGVQLDWNDVAGAAYYAVRRSTNASTDAATWTRLPGNHTASQLQDTGLTGGTTYHYYVTAVDAAGNVSPRSAVVSATPTGSTTTTPTTTTPTTTTPTTTTPTGTGTVLWNGDFTNGLTGYTGIIHGERISVQKDPLGVARNAAKFTVYDSDTGPTENPRAQISSPANIKEGQDVWLGWSTLFPNDFPTSMPSDGWLTFESVYGPPFNGAGPRSIQVKPVGGKPTLMWNRNGTYGYDVPWTHPVVRGKWMDFVVHQKMSTNASVGFVEIFVNTGSGWVQQTLKGQKRLYMKTMDSSNGGGANDHRISSYRKRGMWNVVTIWHAAHKIGTSFDAVAPRSY